MSGNFDLPAASDRNNQPRNPADRAQYRMRLNTRLHHLQNLLDARMSHWSDPVREYTYNVLRRELQALDDASDRRAEVDAADTGERIGFERGSPAENPVPATTRSGAVLDRYSSTTGQRRPRVYAADRLNVIIGATDGDNRINADHSELDSQRRVAARLSGPGLSLGSGFGDTASPVGSSTLAAQGPPTEDRHGRWRHKRRKLDSDDKREGICRFRYGHYGEVVPGTLEMEIVSCDGGTYEASGENSYPENVLLNDSSVYCTKNDRCNLILRHHGETPFCLQKIVIKAPKSGFDAPIQEGMIFVSMALDEFLERTAQYQIVYSSSPLRPRRRRHPRSSFSHRYLSSARSPLRSLERPAVSGPGTWSDSENELTPSSFDSRPIVYRSSASDFRVTTHFDDKSDDDINDEDPDEAPSSTDVDRMRMDQIESEMRCPDLDVDSDEASEWINGLLNGEQRQFRRRMRRAVNDIEAIDSLDGGSSRRLVPSLIEPSSTFRNRDALTDGSEPTASDPEIMKPHARFFIKKEKSMVSIKFDPPVSGKFILIKLWSPFSGGNIDIQSVVVHGFAGPRFFPSMRLR
ncbi:conserved hypothetical protein [Histoplasma capsulatum G186AR]|uniref:Uncharacterized protein n=2 Tax=Ajellomyces capsulatus TaxID=5037 RepID=C0NR64_AJECG|nr:uncharacterized protein HCBG_05494 [Histoplasma capsulatum G186AR]EEH06178.1 conserved hypothetical protein [Histoplasma capsulatum G186AR]